MRMSRKGLMTAVVVVSSACAGVLASAAQASPVGSQGLLPTVWDCFETANPNNTYSNVQASLPAAVNASGPGASHATLPGILTGYTADNAGEPALPFGPYQQVLLDSQGDKTGALKGIVLTCTATSPAAIAGTTLTVAHAGS